MCLGMKLNSPAEFSREGEAYLREKGALHQQRASSRPQKVFLPNGGEVGLGCSESVQGM